MMNKTCFFLFPFLFVSCAGSNKTTINELLRNNEPSKKSYLVDLTGQVGFDLNTGNIIPEFSGTLYKIIDYLNNNDFKKVKVCSSFVGDGEYGFQLAVLRANHVRQFLVENKIDQNKIFMDVSFEKDSKINTNSIFQPLRINIEH